MALLKLSLKRGLKICGEELEDMGVCPTCLMTVGKWSLPWGVSRTVHNNEKNKLKKQIETSTADRFKRVEIPVLNMLRFTDEIAEYIKLSRRLWWTESRAKWWPLMSSPTMEFWEKRLNICLIRLCGGLAEGGMYIDQSWRGWEMFTKALILMMLIECSENE